MAVGAAAYYGLVRREERPTTPEALLRDLVWFGHSSFMIRDSKTERSFYYIDPWNFRDADKDRADVVFITHTHPDHCSPGDLKKILYEKTVFVTVPECVDAFNLPKERVIVVKPEMDFLVKGIRVRTVPAYNLKTERLKWHPKEKNWVGFIIHVNDAAIYHAGDTDLIEEMKSLGPIDVAMLPMGGTYTMDMSEAIMAANAIRAGVTIPMHYRRLLGDNYREAEQKFQSGVQGKAVILKEAS